MDKFQESELCTVVLSYTGRASIIRSPAHMLVSMHPYPHVKQLHLNLLHYFTRSWLSAMEGVPIRWSHSSLPFNLLHVWSKPATARLLHQGSYPLITNSALNTYSTPICPIGVGGLSFKVTCCYNFFTNFVFFYQPSYMLL